MSRSIVRWGVLGAANIARKNWQAIQLCGNGALTAVASRDRARAEQFIAECHGEAPMPTRPAACSYEELLARQDVDAVYVPLPTGVRKEWVIRAAAAGKHVLCEKPCAVNSADLRQMIDACAAAKVQFMDGVMFMHSGRLPLLAQTLADENGVGKIRRLTSCFSFRAGDDFVANNIRAQGPLEPLGCLGDLGWYNVRFFLWALGWKMPRRVSARMLATQPPKQPTSGVPMELSAELFFDDDVSASFFCSFLAENQQWVVVSGTRGFARIPDFVLPFYGSEVAFETTRGEFDARGVRFNMCERTVRHAVAEYSNNANPAQETAMFRRFGEIVASGKLDPHWPDIAIKTQRVVDAVIESARSDGRTIAIA